jgi:hypothetical protein
LFLVGHGAFANVAHIIIKWQVRQKQVVGLTQHGFIESADHVGDEETGDAQMPRTRHHIGDSVFWKRKVRFLKKHKRKTPAPAFYFLFAHFFDEVEDCLREAIAC